MLVVIFDMIGGLFKDVDTWHLEEDDASELADRFHAWWRSIEGKKASAWEKKLVKWQPALMLLLALGMIVGPRLNATLSNRKNAKHLPPKDGHFRNGMRRDDTNPAAATATAAAAPSHDGNPFAAGVRPVEKSQNGNGGYGPFSPAVTGRPAPVVAVGLSREELRSFDPEDVS